MAYDVRFLRGQKEKYDALVAAGTIDANAFYYITDVEPRELYLGQVKVLNKKDLEDAIASLKGDSTSTIKDLEDLLVTLNGDENTEGSIKQQIAAALASQATELSATYAAKEYEGKVDTLIGEDANKSVRAIANEELAKQLIPEGATESLDTLKEIADWIQQHPNDVTAMNTAITELQRIVDGIGGEGEKPDIVTYVNDAIAGLGSSDPALAERVGNIEKDYLKTADKTELTTAINTAKTEAATDATTKAEAAELNAKNYVDTALTWATIE